MYDGSQDPWSEKPIDLGYYFRFVRMNKSPGNNIVSYVLERRMPMPKHDKLQSGRRYAGEAGRVRWREKFTQPTAASELLQAVAFDL